MPKYTRRPKKRTETGVVRRRQWAQQKENRCRYSALRTHWAPRGLRDTGPDAKSHRNNGSLGFCLSGKVTIDVKQEGKNSAD